MDDRTDRAPRQTINAQALNIVDARMHKPREPAAKATAGLHPTRAKG